MKPLRTELQSPNYKPIGWMSIVLWSLCFVGSSSTGDWRASFGFLCFVGLGARLVLAEEIVEVGADSEVIWQTTTSAHYEMKWSEVSKIEFAAQADSADCIAIVLHGHDKRLALSGPAMWKSESRAPMLEFMQSQTQAWNIPQEQTRRAGFRMSKNTRVSLPKRPRPPLSL